MDKAPALMVLDTNIVLDLFVFADTRAVPLRAHLERGEVDWLATAEMRAELERVLAYAHIASRLAFYAIDAAQVLGHFDRHARLVPAPAKAPLTCRDPDDQIFIDLAMRHRCLLLSKDNAVLSMRKRLLAHDVVAAAALPAKPPLQGPTPQTAPREPSASTA
ncbi:MAG: putative toxin-antitoxin system toxin component, PIN family [Ramlibacter sp.]